MTQNYSTNLSYIVSNPSVDGPNVAMNTQETVNGTISVNPVQSTLPGGYDDDWRETQWNAGTTFDPTEGQETYDWNDLDGYSIGLWQQGSATSTSGYSRYAVYQDPQSGVYTYRMSVQGGHYNNQQLSTATNFGREYSLDHPIQLATDINVADVSGSTGYVEGGINFTLQYENGSTSYGLFLQIPVFDGRGYPYAYSSMGNKSSIIYNLTGRTSSYIDISNSATSDTTYKATVNLNQALKSAIDAIGAAYPDDAVALQDMSHWYLTGVYYGVESNGTGLSTDVAGTMSVTNPELTYDDSSTVSYASLPKRATALSLTPETEDSTMTNIVIPGLNDKNIIIEDVGNDNAGIIIQDYAKSISNYASAKTLQTSQLSAGNSSLAGSASAPVEGIINAEGQYTLSGNYAYLFIGSDNGESPSGKVTLNALANSAAYVQVISQNTYGIDATFGNVAGSLVATAGNNLLDMSASTKNWSIATGDGNDTITGGSGTNIISAGKGNNLIKLGKSNNYVRSEGTDTIVGVRGAIDTVSLLGGNSTATLYTNTAVVDLSSNNHISVADNSTVFGGTESYINVISGDATVVGAVRDTITAAGNLTVTHGTNLDLRVSGDLTFIAGTGNSTVSSGTGTVWGAQGLNITLNSQSHLLFTANQPNATGDQYVDASKNESAMSFWTGAGNQTIIGGTGVDSFYFGTQFAGVSTSTVAATVTGGTGAGNMFGLLKNHTAGNFYITDFRAADNKFFMYFYKPSDPTQAAQNLLNNATISGGNTSILIDGDARVTFLGVTDLRASDFQIS